MYTFSGNNPTTLYKNILYYVVEHGDELSPRGKLVKEIRPVSIEFLNPLNRTTFLATRRINPFFQLAESMQIISGINDAEWLSMFNANMISFSDDGKKFNAFYGERIRRWGDNDAHEIKAQNGSLDQLYDVYRRILDDKDTRQAMMAIGNPSFDNYQYLNVEKGKDIACNLYITFKVRDDKLQMVVFNRSNDLHWGVFGANIVQFSTIQETLCSWLRNSGNEEFKSLTLGTYHQVTDSLHIYLDSYGAKATDDILSYYNEHKYVEPSWTFADEPRVNSSYIVYTNSINRYWNSLDKIITQDDITLQDAEELFDRVSKLEKHGELDSYIAFTVKAMLCYRLIKMHRIDVALTVMSLIDECSWKVSMMYFMRQFISNTQDDSTRLSYINRYNGIVDNMCIKLLDNSGASSLNEYLRIEER